MSKIAIIGGIYRDFQVFVEDIPKENEAKVVEKINITTGGKLVNASITMSRLGNEIFYLAKVGDDEEGNEAIRFLEKEGINTKNIIKDKNERTGYVVFLTNKVGKSAFAVYHAANDILTKEEVSNFISYTSEQKIEYIYTSTSLPLDLLEHIADEAQKFGIAVFIDIPNKHKEIKISLFSKVDFISPNKFEASLLTGMEIKNEKDALVAASSLKEKGANNVLITMGDEGVVVSLKEWDEPKYFQVEKKEEVDGTAAGDVFRGAFLSEFLKGKSIEDMVEFASKLAGITAGKKGAYESIPTQADIKDLT